MRLLEGRRSDEVAHNPTDVELQGLRADIDDLVRVMERRLVFLALNPRNVRVLVRRWIRNLGGAPTTALPPVLVSSEVPSYHELPRNPSFLAHVPRCEIAQHAPFPVGNVLEANVRPAWVGRWFNRIIFNLGLEGWPNDSDLQLFPLPQGEKTKLSWGYSPDPRILQFFLERAHLIPAPFLGKTVVCLDWEYHEERGEVTHRYVAGLECSATPEGPRVRFTFVSVELLAESQYLAIRLARCEDG